LQSYSIYEIMEREDINRIKELIQEGLNFNDIRLMGNLINKVNKVKPRAQLSKEDDVLCRLKRLKEDDKAVLYLIGLLYIKTPNEPPECLNAGLSILRDSTVKRASYIPVIKGTALEDWRKIELELTSKLLGEEDIS